MTSVISPVPQTMVSPKDSGPGEREGGKDMKQRVRENKLLNCFMKDTVDQLKVFRKEDNYYVYNFSPYNYFIFAVLCIYLVYNVYLYAYQYILHCLGTSNHMDKKDV